MTNGNLQISPPSYIENRVVRQSSNMQRDDEENSLILDVIQRRWKMLCLCFLASLATGGYCYYNFTLPESETRAMMMFRPLPPTSGIARPDPMDPMTIKEVFVSDENLRELTKKYGLKTSPKKFRDYFEVKASRFVNLINVKFDWNDGKEGIDMTNDMMRIVSDRIMQSRQEVFRQYLKNQNQQLEEVDIQIEQARQRLAQLTQQNQKLMVQDGRDTAQSGMLQSLIVTTTNELNDATLASQTIARQISDLRTSISKTEEALRVASLKGKLAQYEARKQIYKKPSGKMAELEKRIQNFDVENSSLDYPAWKSKLDLLGNTSRNNLLVHFPNPNAPSIAKTEIELAKLRDRLGDLEIDLAPLNEKISLLHNRAEEYKRDFASSQGDVELATSQIDAARNKIEELRDQRVDVLKMKMNFQNFSVSPFRELDIHTEASWDTTEVFNGKKKLFVLAFAGALFLLTIPVFALEHFFPSHVPAESAAKECNIPIVGRETFIKDYQSQNANYVNSESLRLLALRIQQSVQSPGSTVLFSGLNHDQSSIPTLTYLAECLSRREERVLIIDACDHSADDKKGRNGRKKKQVDSITLANKKKSANAPTVNGSSDNPKNRDLVSQEENPVSLGLSEFFKSTNLDPKDLVCTTDIPGVDIIPAGSSGFPDEAFGSRRLNDLFDAYRGEYTMILVAGPSTNHPSDLHMLSARADGILFTLPNSGRRQSQGEDVVNELRDLGAPIIGIVS